MATVAKTFDADLALRWIEALESDQYEQGRGRLRTGDAFCCLGVACDVADPGQWNSKYGAMFWDDSKSHLPEILCNRLALWMSGEFPDSDDKWQLPDRNPSRFLTDLNDSGAPFTDIATALRDYYGSPPRTEKSE